MSGTQARVPAYLDGFVKPPKFDDPTFSDAKLIFGERIIHVHRVILAHHSLYFHKAFTGNFKEARDREIHLPSQDYDLWYLLVSILYLDWPDDLAELPAVKKYVRPDNCFEFLAVVDYVQVTRLRKAVESFIVKVLRVLGQKDYVSKYPDATATQIQRTTRFIYDMHPQGSEELRQALLKVYGADHVRNWLIHGTFDLLLAELPELSVDLLMFFLRKQQS